ncbi:MAG: ankyrin repeat domain-containing protein [Mycoplasmoidaceae bacterium]
MNRRRINSKEYNLLFDACNLGNIKLIKAVCDYEIINHQNESGYTLLSIACMRNDILMIKTLLKFLPNPNIKTHDGFSALMFCIKNNNLAAVKLLVEIGADLHDKKVMASSLIYATSYGFYDIIEYLISQKVKVNIADVDKNNLLMIAAKEGHLKIAKFLIEKGIDIHLTNKAGNNALMFAIQANNIDIVKTIIKNGIDVNAYNKNGTTALMLAVQFQRYHIIDELLKIKDLDINRVDFDGYTALMYGCLIDDLKAIAFLLNHKKTNINKSNHNNETALMIAIKRDNEAIVSLLLSKMADVNIKNIKGENALKLAALNGNFEIAKLILNYSPDNYQQYDKNLIENYKRSILKLEEDLILKELVTDYSDHKKAQLNVQEEKISSDPIIHLINLEEEPNEQVLSFDHKIEHNLNINSQDDLSNDKIKLLDEEEIREQLTIIKKIDHSIYELLKAAHDEKLKQKDFDQSWLDLHIMEQRAILNDPNLTIIQKMEKWIQFVSKPKVEWAPIDRFDNHNELIFIEDSNLKIDENKYREKIFAYWEKLQKEKGV